MGFIQQYGIKTSQTTTLGCFQYT